MMGVSKWSLFVFLVSCPIASLSEDSLPSCAVLNMLLERLIKSTDNLDERLGTLQENFEKFDQRLNEQNDQIMTLSSGVLKQGERITVIESNLQENMHLIDQLAKFENIEKQLTEQENEMGNLKTDLRADMAREAADHRHQLTVQRRGLFSLKRQLLSSQETYKTVDKELVDHSAEIADIKEQIAELGNLSFSLQAEITSGTADQRHQLTDQRQELIDLRRQFLSSNETFYHRIDTVENNVQRCIDKEIVSFSARVKPSISNIGKYTTIKFAGVETNIGNAYDSTTGEFTAPLAGVYVFSATILAKQNNYLETVVKVNDEVKLWLYSGDGKYYGSSSNLLVSHLNKGDKVKMTTYCCGSKPFYIHHYWSTFSGFLIAADEY